MRHILIPVVAALLLALAAPIHATVLLPGDLGDIARGAAAIVRGTVVGTQTEWADGRRRVLTIVTLDVEESLKGGMTGRVSFQVPGGLMGRYRSVMVGAPVFHQGEEVIVCLGAQAPALPYVLGLSQGVFRIRRDVASGQKVVTTPALLSDSAQTVTVQRGDPARRALSLDEFAARVRVALSGADKTRREPRSGDIKGSPHS